jgi:hypothetical protein
VVHTAANKRRAAEMVHEGVACDDAAVSGLDRPAAVVVILKATDAELP